MFDLLILIVVLLIGVSLGRRFRDLPDEELVEDEQDPLKRIEQLEVEIMEQDGMFYCWSKDPIDGVSFVGQADTTEKLEQMFLEFTRKKYAVS